MKFTLGTVLLGSTALALAASTATADIPASYTGNGGLIPASGTGGGGVWNGGQNATSLPTAPSIFSLTIDDPVKSIKSISFENLNHTWIGDLHFVLTTPDNLSYNILVRPGRPFEGGGVGWSDNFINANNYSFSDGGAPIPGGQGTGFNIPSGDYLWGFNSSTWMDDNFGFQNAAASDISSTQGGTWTLTIYDWAAGDIGSLGTWTLNVNLVPAPGALALLGLAGLAGVRRRRAA